jgi:hypothetical protein
MEGVITVEELLQWGLTGLRVMLAGVFALAPGALVWLVVLGVYLSIRHLGLADFMHRLRHQEIQS